MLQLLKLFKELDYEISFCSTAKPLPDTCLDQLNIPYTQIQLNHDSFNHFIAKLAPNMVVFDRFMTEEQFGWRVKEHCPNALRILDTEDLHFLRMHRQQHNDGSLPSLQLSDIAKRELSAMYRSDLSLIISKFEFRFLVSDLGVSNSMLHHLPFLVESKNIKKELPSFNEREGFYFVGNGKHAPNVDAIMYLHANWPKLRTSLAGATLHIYGAYLPEYIKQLHSPKSSFFVHGYVKELNAAIQKHRVLLASINFGAGQKRKIFDAWLTGSAVVTSVIGAEGIGDSNNFGGYIYKDEAQFLEFARAVYSQEEEWTKAVNDGLELLATSFNRESFKREFSAVLAELTANLTAFRNQNTFGQILWHQSLQSTKYLSKWIQEKNKSKEPPAS
jgi:glycosyltransferase involved in cell wall biosynthesis